MSSSSEEEVILDSNEKSAEVSSLSSSLHPLPPSYQSSRSLRGGFEPGDSRRMTEFCDLPEKAVVEIMSWLPPKSLFRLKCVQKSWYGLIRTLVKSQWFVAKHLKNSQSNSYVFQRNSPLYCLQLRNDKTRNWFMSFNKAENWNSRIYFDVKEFNVPRCMTDGYGSHCNGILFLADRKTNKVLLFNPALRELKLLQSSCFGSNFKTLVMAGFGYDASADVYKVVRIVRLCSTAVGARIRAEVFTLGNHGDSWREIKMKIEIDVSSLTLDEVNHRGVCYWVICDKFYTKKMLISFDLHEEEFQIIPFPDDHDREEFGATSATTIINWRLFMWNERVTLLRNVASISPWLPNSDAKPMRMWLLDEISGGNLQKKAFCWTKYADLLSGGNIRYFPIVFWRNDELLCFTYQKGLVSYNLSTQKLRTVKLDPPENGSFHAFVYVESLVSIEGARQMI